MAQVEIGLDQWVGARIVDHAVGRDAAIGVADQSHEIAAAFGPLAGRRRADHGQAGIDRRALEGGLGDAKVGLHALPLQAVVGVAGGGVRTVGGQRTVVDLAVGQIGHGRQIEQTAVVGRVAAEGSIGRVGVGQAGVVAAQLAVGVADRSEPLAGAGPLGQAELGAVVAAAGLDYRRALGAERHGGQVVVAVGVRAMTTGRCSTSANCVPGLPM